MDIALKLKRAVAILATGAIFASSAGAALAQTFNDVHTDAWYYDFVEQLVTDGVVDSADNFRPNDALNRAELVKMSVTAIDGLAGYTAPATPTFSDVPADAWFYDYVEAAVQLGIVSGYTDASGNLTGKFGPSDTVNRAAATKILDNAFSVPTTLTPGSIFPDVKPADWFHDYVLTAYNQSVVDGYANGYFGPADPVTRAQVAKMMVKSQKPVERTTTPDNGGTTPPDNGGTTPPTTTSTGDLEVSLNDNTPASSTLPLGANGVALASFDLTANQDDVWVSNLVVTRGGVGQVGDWENLYLYDGSNRLTTGRTINKDTNTSTFPLKLTVNAGTTTTLTLVGDVTGPGAAGASNQHYFYVASAANVTSNAVSVSGDFPVAGNTFTMGGSNTVVNGITVAPGTAPSKVTIGEQDAEIASVKLTAGSTDDLAVYQLALTNGGALSSAKMSNLRLLRGTDEVATADGFVGDVVTFVLDTPYVIPEGQSKTFYVHADIDGGRSTDTIVLYLDENTDMVAIDQQYGFGGSVTNSFTQSLANSVTLEGGDVTVVDNGPAAHQIAQNTTNIELLNYSITTARDLTVRDTFVQIDVQDANGNGPTLPVTGTGHVENEATQDTSSFCMSNGDGGTFDIGDMIQVTATSGTVYAMITDILGLGTGACAHTEIQTGLATGDDIDTNAVVTEVNPYDYVKNVKLVDLDSGNTLAGPMTDANSGAESVANGGNGAISYFKVHTEDYELVGGETRHLSVQADLDQNMASGYQIKARVRYSDGGANSYIKDLGSNEFVLSSAIIGAGATALAGDFMSTAANSLTVSRASTPTSHSYVKGDPAVPALGIAMTAGDAGDILLKRLDVRVYGDVTGAGSFSATGDTAANTLVSSVTIYDGNDVVAGPKSITLVDHGAAGFLQADSDYYRAQFTDLNLLLKAGATKTLTAKVKLLNTQSVATYVAVDVLPSEDIIAEDSDANTIVASGSALNATANAHNPLLTIATSGSLTAVSQGNPDSDIVLAGSTQQLVAKYRFRAENEAYEVNKLTIVNDLAGDFGDAGVLTSAVSNVTLKFNDVNGVQQSAVSSLSGAGGTAKFAGLKFYVPQGKDSYLEVYADVNTKAAVGESISGKTFRLGLQNSGNDQNSFDAVGLSSSAKENFLGAPAASVSNSSSVNAFVVRTAIPVFANVSASTNLVAGGDKTLMSFSITPDGGSVSFGRLVFNVTLFDADAGGELALNTFKFYKGSTLIPSTDVNIYDGGNNMSDANDNMSAGIVIVSFDQEQIVSGSSQTYSLKANVVGPQTNDSIDTKLAEGDESTPVSGLTVNNGNDNTGRIYSANANEGLITSGANDFADTVGAARNIIWSDGSADAHTYPTATAGPTGGTLTSASGTYDWTNGYRLGLTSLASQNLQKN